MGDNRLRWDDVEIFCLLAEFGSIRQTAAQCGQSVETVRRRINALEVSLGERLFRRTAQGLAITHAGKEILADARRARDAVLAISRMAGADAAKRSRKIRVSAPEDIGANWLIPELAGGIIGGASCAIAAEARRANEVVEWESTDAAIVYAPPDRSDIVCRKIGAIRYALYTNKRDRTFSLGRQTDLLTTKEVLILPGRSHPILPDFENDERWDAARRRSILEVDSTAATLNILAKRPALAILPVVVAERHEFLERAPEGVAPQPELEIFLAFHADIRKSAASSRVLDAIISLTAAPSRTLA